VPTIHWSSYANAVYSSSISAEHGSTAPVNTWDLHEPGVLPTVGANLSRFDDPHLAQDGMDWRPDPSSALAASARHVIRDVLADHRGRGRR
jgi:hypothetical protein